jgi:hypothetical protein
MASAWNLFVKKVYWENKKKNKSYKFKDALKEASRRKGEMGNTKTAKNSKSYKKGGKRGRGSRGKSKKMRGGTGNMPSSSFGSNALQFEAGNAA